MKVSVIIPSRQRTAQLIRCVDGLLATTTEFDREVVIVVDGDEDCLTAIEQEIPRWGYRDGDSIVRAVYQPLRCGPAASWNNGLRACHGDVIVLGADDLVFHENWLTEAMAVLEKLPGGDGLVGFNDLSGRGDYRYITDDNTIYRRVLPHWLCTRNFLIEECNGSLSPPDYTNYYFDVEICARAHVVGKFAYAEDSLVEHRHYNLGKAEKDATYETGPAEDNDRLTFFRRERQGFPDDFDPILPGTREHNARKPLPEFDRKVSVIMPSYGRAEQLISCVYHLLYSVQRELEAGLQFEVIIVADDDGLTKPAVLEEIKISRDWSRYVRLLYREENTGLMSTWNDGLKAATGDLIVFGSDDLWFAEGWLTSAIKALSALPDHDGLVGFNDGSGREREFSTHWLCTRRWIQRESGGCLVTPLYQRQFCDPEACYRAKRSNHYIQAVRTVVEHRHHLWGKAAFDQTYALNNQAIFMEDRDLYAARLAAGFPDNFPPAIEVPRVFWAVPRERFSFNEAARALENVAMHCQDLGYIKIEAGYAATDTAREGFTRKFLELSHHPDDVLVMLDNDHEHPSDVVERLANVGNVGVAGALVRRRGDELDALLFRRNPVTKRMDRIAEWPAGELVEVDLVGAGAIAVRRWVFDRLRARFGIKYWFWQYAYSTKSSERPGEEIYFQRMCEEDGIKIACDTSLICPHLIVTTVEKIIAVAEAAARGEDWKKCL